MMLLVRDDEVLHLYIQSPLSAFFHFSCGNVCANKSWDWRLGTRLLLAARSVDLLPSFVA